MPGFFVTWSIDAEDQRSPLEAAQYALEVQRNPESIATVFHVSDPDSGQEWQVDLGGADGTATVAKVAG